MNRERAPLATSKSLLLHIGVHKTGSTSIQGMLRSAGDALARHGLHFVASGRNADGNHVGLVEGVREAGDGDSLPLAWVQAIDEITASPHDTAIVSSEDFSVLDEAGIGRLARWLENAGLRVTVIVFLREQFEVLRSNYIELLKQGRTESDFERYLALASTEFDPVHSLARFDYQRVLAPWALAFGTESLRAVAYRPQRDSVRQFLEAIGHPTLAPTRARPRLNTSPGARAVAALLLVNRALALHTDLSDGRRTQIAYSSYRRAVLRYPGKSAGLTVDARWRDAVIAHYEPCNRWLATTFGIRFAAARSARGETAEPLEPDEVRHWLDVIAGDVQFSRTLVVSDAAEATPDDRSESSRRVDPATVPSSEPAAPVARAAVLAPPPPPRHPALSMFDQPEEFAWSPGGDRARAERERWTFALDHPRLRARLYERYLGGRDPISYALSRLGGHPVAHALEVGCGSGDLAISLRTAGICRHIDAFDASPEAIARARAAADSTGLDGLHFYVAEPAAPGLRDGRYDFVYASDALHRVAELEALFAALHRALKPDGLLFAKEYVGPARMQYGTTQVEWINRALSSLPSGKRFERGLPARVRGRFVPLAADDFERSGSREMIRSDQIVPVMRRWFDVEVLPLGMSLLYDTLRGLVHHFDPADAADNALLDALLLADEAALEGGLVPVCFACIVARPRPAQDAG